MTIIPKPKLTVTRTTRLPSLAFRSTNSRTCSRCWCKPGGGGCSAKNCSAENKGRSAPSCDAEDSVAGISLWSYQVPKVGSPIFVASEQPRNGLPSCCTRVDMPNTEPGVGDYRTCPRSPFARSLAQICQVERLVAMHECTTRSGDVADGTGVVMWWCNVARRAWLPKSTGLVLSPSHSSQPARAMNGLARQGQASRAVSHLLLAGHNPVSPPLAYSSPTARQSPSNPSLTAVPFGHWLGAVGRARDVEAGWRLCGSGIGPGHGHALVAYRNGLGDERVFAAGRNEAGQLGIGYASQEDTRGLVEGFRGSALLRRWGPTCC